MNTYPELSPAGRRLYSIEKVAELLSVDPSTVRRFIEGGELVVIRLGGRRLVADSDLAAFIDAHRTEQE